MPRIHIDWRGWLSGAWGRVGFKGISVTYKTKTIFHVFYVYMRLLYACFFKNSAVRRCTIGGFRMYKGVLNDMIRLR